MRLIAPAKINWTLEVLGPRDDGFHEVRSVMQTIDLFDEVSVKPANTLSLIEHEEQTSSQENLALRAACLLADATGQRSGAAIKLRKKIPAAAGLGGGSSDAAAVLRGLDRLWGLSFGQERLADIAAALGSDAPFFLYGGTALAWGRGERITPLPDVPQTWPVLLVPPFTLPQKTKRLYAALTAADFADGSRSEALARRIEAGQPIDDDCLCNAFERAAYETFAGLVSYREALLAAGARRAHLAGSGPTLFALAGSEREARQMQRRLRSSPGRGRVARTLTAREARVIEE